MTVAFAPGVAAPVRAGGRAVGVAAPARARASDLRRRIAGGSAVAAVVLVVVLLTLNLNGAPYVEDDEGTYAAQALAVLHQGALSPHTYFYDHPPGGWLQLAAWFALTGDGAGVGGAVADGRLFMVLVQVVSMLLVLWIGRRLTGSVWAGIVAMLLFGLSPYALFFHRRVLLDNLAAMWLLVSTALLLSRKLTLVRVVLAAVALGAAVWSKEIAVVLLPALGLLAVRRCPRESRTFVLAGWLAVAGGIASLYVLMALLKGELFPSGTLLGGSAPHVSLLGTLAWESARGADGGLLSPSSGFWASAAKWAGQDPVLVVGGTLAAIVSIALVRTRPGLSSLGVAVVTALLFLGRGGLTLDFYLVPVVPFLALSLVGVVWWAAGPGRVRLVALGAFGAGVLGIGIAGNIPLWTAAPADGQTAAVAWVRQHVAPGSRILTDMYAYPALHAGAHPFRRAEYYWTATDDPAVLNGVFHDRWQDVDYLIVTPQMLLDARYQPFPFLNGALSHSTRVAAFDTGYRVEIRRVHP